MQSLTISLNLITDLKEFINMVSTLDCDVDIVRGRYVIDAKSAMALFTLDLSKPFDLIIHSDEENIVEKFYRWVVK